MKKTFSTASLVAFVWLLACFFSLLAFPASGITDLCRERRVWLSFPYLLEKSDSSGSETYLCVGHRSTWNEWTSVDGITVDREVVRMVKTVFVDDQWIVVCLDEDGQWFWSKGARYVAVPVGKPHQSPVAYSSLDVLIAQVYRGKLEASAMKFRNFDEVWSDTRKARNKNVGMFVCVLVLTVGGVYFVKKLLKEKHD